MAWFFTPPIWMIESFFTDSNALPEHRMERPKQRTKTRKAMVFCTSLEMIVS